MTNKYYHTWLISFKDSKPPSSSFSLLNDSEHYMKIMLSRIYEQINGKRKKSLTQIPEDKTAFSLPRVIVNLRIIGSHASLRQLVAKGSDEHSSCSNRSV